MGKKLVLASVVVAVVALAVTREWYKGLPAKGEGFAAPGWRRVAEVFKQQVESGSHKGGGFAVFHNGELVMEFVGGYADYESEMQWEKTTLSCLHSATKGLGAVVIAMLVDRGLIDYSSPVAKYWPEFAQNGKELITVEQLLSHQAGLVTLDENFSLFDLSLKPERISHLLASAKTQWVPGHNHGIHSTTIGLYMDQLVRRVDPHHRSLDQFFAEEVSQKFGIDCFIGLPKEENYRCARLQNPFSLSSIFDLLTTPKYWKMAYASLFDANSYIMKTSNNYAEGKRNLQNNPTFREIPSTSTHGFSTVTSLALLYGILANGGLHNNLTLLSPSAINRLNEPLVSGVDSVLFLNVTIGRGTVLKRSKDGQNIFGHPGFGAGFADPKHRLGWAYLTNYPSFFTDADDWKYLQLVDAMYDTVLEIENTGKSHQIRNL